MDLASKIVGGFGQKREEGESAFDGKENTDGTPKQDFFFSIALFISFSSLFSSSLLSGNILAILRVGWGRGASQRKSQHPGVCL